MMIWILYSAYLRFNFFCYYPFAKYNITKVSYVSYFTRNRWVMKTDVKLVLTMLLMQTYLCRWFIFRLILNLKEEVIWTWFSTSNLILTTSSSIGILRVRLAHGLSQRCTLYINNILTTHITNDAMLIETMFLNNSIYIYTHTHIIHWLTF